MARKSTKQTRLDGMNQYKKRSYQKKNSPQGRKDGRDWTFHTMKKLEGLRENEPNNNGS